MKVSSKMKLFQLAGFQLTLSASKGRNGLGNTWLRAFMQMTELSQETESSLALSLFQMLLQHWICGTQHWWLSCKSSRCILTPMTSWVWELCVLSTKTSFLWMWGPITQRSESSQISCVSPQVHLNINNGELIQVKDQWQTLMPKSVQTDIYPLARSWVIQAEGGTGASNTDHSCQCELKAQDEYLINSFTYCYNHGCGTVIHLLI